MIAIAYLSTAVHAPTRFELEHLLLDARTFNARVGVTGALLLHDVTFFQYFEGPAAAAEDVYVRIQRARSHRDIVELVHAPVERRHFDGWLMGFLHAPQGTLLELSNARWHAQAEHMPPDASTPGVDLLLDFWRRGRKEL